MAACTQEQFLTDIAKHEMTVIRDDGENRHLRFKRSDSIIYHFDLITWPGHLCITGDCGTYVFSRVRDMFSFFRNEQLELAINPGYWGEKLLSVDRNGGYREFDSERFEKRVTDHFNNWKESEEPGEEAAAELWEEIEQSVLSAAHDGELHAYHAVNDFEHDGFEFQDFFDGGGTESFTSLYLWCLYAIVWGIQQYDIAAAKAA